MAPRKSRSSSCSPLSRRNQNLKLHTLVEEIGDGEDAKPPPMTPPRGLKRTFALSCIYSILPSPLRSPQSPSPTKTPAKLHDEEDSDYQPPPGGPSRSRYDHRGVPARKPPPSPTNRPQPRSSSAPRQEHASRTLQKPASPSRNQQLVDHNASTEPLRRERANTLAPPTSQIAAQGHTVSSPANSRPTSYHSDQEASRGGRLSKRKSWLNLSRSRNTSQDLDPSRLPPAWVEMDGHKLDYSLTLLLQGKEVGELLAKDGDTFVYLFPRETGPQAQFKIHSPSIASSPILHGLSIGNASSIGNRRRTRSFDGRNSLAIEDAVRNLSVNAQGATPQTRNFPIDNQSISEGSNESVRSLQDGPREYHLYFPSDLSSTGPELSARDIQRLVDIRNFFAFLEGQALVRTRACPTLFLVLLSIASMLQEFEYTNIDGSTYGEAPSTAFDFLSGIEKLGDVSWSREKTIEGIILGERMRSVDLYNEAFAHGVGKYEALQTVNPALYSQISPDTRKRLDRAYLDLGQRQRAAEIRLTDFEFPSLFAGIAASTSSVEAKLVRFKAWKSHFLNLRKVVLSYYKDLHGQWPPKARSKKNNFVEGGLNRFVLKGLYNDLCGLYELLADREAITTRGINASDDKDTANVDPTAAALRRLLGEFDRSSPPVTPPIPFDIPILPSMATLNPSYYGMGPMEQNKLDNRKLKDYENQLVVTKAHNLIMKDKEGIWKTRAPFLDMFRAFEAKEARGKTCSQLADMRYGHWIFLYAVLQSLPMLVVDAPGLRYTDGVEYFLCEPSMGNPPWMEDAGVKREWYGVASSGHAVVLPSDLVVHGVEGIFRRSYCWTEAQKWINDSGGSIHEVSTTEINRSSALSPLPPPPGFVGGQLDARSFSRGRDESRNSVGSSDGLRAESRGRSRQSQRNSIALGLEQLPIPIASGSGSPSLSATGSRGVSPLGMNPYDNGGRRISSSGPSSGRRLSTGPLGDEGITGSTFDDILGKMTPEKPKESGRGLMGRFK